VVLNAERLYNYFASNFDLSKSTKGWYRFANPFKLSSEPTMAIHFDYNFVKCYKTGYKDHCMNFICQYEDITYREAVQLIGGYDELEFKDYTTFVKKQVVFKLPDHFRPLYSEGIFSKRLIAYLEGRGFDTRLLNNMGFGYCDDGDFMGFLIVPFTRKGKLVYYIGRDFLGRSMRYKNPKSEDLSLSKSDLFFNEDALDLYDEVYLVEGWSDALKSSDKAISYDLPSAKNEPFSEYACKAKCVEGYLPHVFMDWSVIILNVLVLKFYILNIAYVCVWDYQDNI